MAVAVLSRRASSAGDAGFSYYYRQSSTGTFSGDWAFATRGLHDNFDHSETPASDYDILRKE